MIEKWNFQARKQGDHLPPSRRTSLQDAACIKLRCFRGAASEEKKKRKKLRNLFLHSETIFWWKININISNLQSKHNSSEVAQFALVSASQHEFKCEEENWKWKTIRQQLVDILQGAEGGSEARGKGVEAKWKKVLGVSMAIGRSDIILGVIMAIL